MAIIDDFKARFPEFTTADVDARLPFLESEYQCYYNFPYEDCYKVAILYLLAHMMLGETSTKTGASRQVESKSVGSVSVSYASLESTSNRTAWLNSSKYGQRFLNLVGLRQGAYFV